MEYNPVKNQGIQLYAIEFNLKKVRENIEVLLRTLEEILSDEKQLQNYQVLSLDGYFYVLKAFATDERIASAISMLGDVPMLRLQHTALGTTFHKITHYLRNIKSDIVETVIVKMFIPSHKGKLNYAKYSTWESEDYSYAAPTFDVQLILNGLSQEQLDALVSAINQQFPSANARRMDYVRVEKGEGYLICGVIRVSETIFNEEKFIELFVAAFIKLNKTEPHVVVHLKEQVEPQGLEDKIAELLATCESMAKSNGFSLNIKQHYIEQITFQVQQLCACLQSSQGLSGELEEHHQISKNILRTYYNLQAELVGQNSLSAFRFFQSTQFKEKLSAVAKVGNVDLESLTNLDAMVAPAKKLQM